MKSTQGKIAFFAALFATFALGVAFAQPQPGPGPGFGPPPGGSPMQRLTEELGLDDAQAAEIQAIHGAARDLHREQQMRTFRALEALREETHAAIMQVLDPGQQARFQELLELRTERWGEGPGPGMGPRGPMGAGACPDPDCPNPDCPNG